MTWRKALEVAAIGGVGCLLVLETLGLLMAFRSSGAPPVNVRNTDPRYWEGRARVLRQRLAAMAPQGLYAVVDTAGNVLTLKKGDRVVRTAVVSAGSGSVLDDPAGNRQWVFDTPRGVRSVQSKVENPVWVRPDWAFIEEGEPIPKKYNARLDPGAMGDYAIGLGEGYFIHGTLYTRLLGRNVTHGCVRVGDQDLKAIYHALSLGSRVILF
jgi:lipoprotein-anchoring transpeptidase ErfK/SrfK